MKKRSMNQKGSVLLAVVCMTMICMTLATIALHVVHKTMQSSNKNVQRAQAKVTAETALTEFIDYFQTQEGSFENLLTYASGSSRETGTEIDVSMLGDANFEQNFGDCKLYVYNYGTGFKVDSVCEFASQTQTASIFFNVEVNTPYVPSNALETTKNASISGGVATPIGGNTYIERDDTDPTLPHHLKLSNNATYKGHFFSQYNIDINNSATYLEDGLNKTGTTNFYHPDENFMQAPTITVDGYLLCTNSGSGIRTTVGKSDVSGRNSDDYATESEYQLQELSNTDGYIYTFKKLVMCGNPMQIGASGRDIDIYCHGAYFGPVPAKLNGVTTEREVILEAFDNSVPEQSSSSPEVYGNLYSYKGQSAQLQSGDLVINVGAHNLTVNGDVYVKGDIYLVGGSGIKANKLTCDGTIYTCDGSGNVTKQCHIQAKAGGGYELSGTANIVASDLAIITDTTIKRNQLPEVGYDPATGVTSTVRKGLSVYQGCSSNDMFDKSINGNAEEKSATKNIAYKYAQAMTRSLSGNYLDTAGVEHAVSSDFDTNIKTIHASTKLTPNEVQKYNNTVVNYLVDITDEDIVIALPLGTKTTNPWGGSSISQCISSKFRINRSNNATANNYFCYFVFYDPANPNKNYYLDDWLTGSTLEGNAFNFEGTTQAERDAKAINFKRDDIGSVSGDLLVADYASVYTDPLPANSDYTFRFDSSTCGYTLPNLSTYKNYIMYLIPDGTEFQLGGSGQPTSIQGIVYGLKSNVSVSIPNQNKIFGQVKCSTFNPPADIKEGVIQDVPIANGSILGFVEIKNATEKNIDIQYYEY